MNQLIANVSFLIQSIQEIHNSGVLELIVIAIIYSCISIFSCGGIIFFIFLKYIRQTYKLAKQTREHLLKEEKQLIKLSDKIVNCSEKLRLIYTEKTEVKITIIQDNNQH